MRHLLNDVLQGRFCTANVSIALAGVLSQLTLKDAAQIFAATATGVWFMTQTVLALKRRRRRGR